MNFASDNTSGVLPEIMGAIARANAGYQASYGKDIWTKGLKLKFDEIFNCETIVFPVLTGGAANRLALNALIEPQGKVYCHQDAHIHAMEREAFRFYTHGLSELDLIAGKNGKIDPTSLQKELERGRPNGGSVKSALTLTQATEWGTIYTVEEIKTLTTIAKVHSLSVHMDGARFANAVASLKCSPADITWQAGIDVMSFGATKNGALTADAVVFFNPDYAKDFYRRCEWAGQVVSKMRFISAQLDAYLHDDLWLCSANHANLMALRLMERLSQIAGITPLQPVQANMIFVSMTKELLAKLEKSGAGYYLLGFNENNLPLIRLVASFSTADQDIDDLIKILS